MITEGGRKLRHITKISQGGVTGFAAKAGVPRQYVHRAMNGERYARITVDFAFRCERASGGFIRAEDFLPETAKPLEDVGDDDYPARRPRAARAEVRESA